MSATLDGVPDITGPMGQADSDESAVRRFGRMFDAHRRSVLAYALRRLDNPEDAADVVAETFLVAWRRLDDIPQGELVRAWLLGVARRVLANQHRSERRRIGLADRLRRELATQVAPIREASASDLLVRRALAQLSEGDREILLLASWEGLAPAEIAVAIGIGRVAARSRLHRARARLRAALDDLSLEGPEGAPADRSTALDLAREETR